MEVSGRIYDRDDDNNSLQSVIYLELQAIKKNWVKNNSTVQSSKYQSTTQGAHRRHLFPALTLFYIKWEQFLQEWKDTQ